MFKLVRGTILLFVLELAVHTFFAVNLKKKSYDILAVTNKPLTLHIHKKALVLACFCSKSLVSSKINDIRKLGIQ
jgi:hypothetical protein